MKKRYIVNEKHHVMLNDELVLSNSTIVEALHFANEALRTLSDTTRDFDIDIFEALGLRNLSGIVGEYCVKSVERHSDGILVSNPHQDGYPDLLLVDTAEKREYFESLHTVVDGNTHPREKEYFSPFKYGGIEVKATCGSTPPAHKVPKPLIGQQRISLVNGFDWKAHHRETNNLLGIFWDFIDGLPTVTACFYRNDLTADDWGNIVQPTKGGGRTTSVSVMRAQGIRKMCAGWIMVIDLPEYIEAFSQNRWIGYRVS